MCESIISGVVSGIIASACFMFILYGIRPKIRISNKVTLEMVEGEWILQVKIANMTKHMINDVNYALYYCSINDDGINDIAEIPTRKAILSNISGFTNMNDEDAEYAIRISFRANDFEFPLDDDDKLIFVISAKHSISNTSVCVRQEYYRDDIFVDGMFESKTSMKAIRKH